MMKRFVSFLLILVTIQCNLVEGGERKAALATEEERLKEYARRGHSWPPKEYVPNTEGWKKIMDQRIAQIDANRNSQEKWDGWMQTMTSALTLPNHTEFGWGLTQAPMALTREIRQGIEEGLPTARPEGDFDVIDGGLQPHFVDRPDLTEKASRTLQPILEAWSGMELIPSIAYGFRIYRNESRLWMHVDRVQTHVISCIYHIGSSEGSDPWPITIEDYDGNTNSVVLKPGDVLLYESAKNFHGRPTAFNGEWYTSLFVHFFPKDPAWSAQNHDLDSVYAIPSHWRDIVPNDEYPHLRVIGTSMMEPDCPDFWCNLQNAINLEGPGEYGMVLTGRNKKYSLNLNEVDNGEEEEEEL